MAIKMVKNNQIRVLFVCMGNICRSPTAEAVLRRLLQLEAPELAVTIDSAATHDYHVGRPPDPRSQTAARRRGFDLAALRARQLEPRDFEIFDYVLCMDEQNRRDALAISPKAASARLALEFAPEQELREVPDPYYGGPAGFEQVLDLLEACARGLIRELRERR